MKYTIKFRPEIEDDAINAYKWYETKSIGLGEDFLRVFYANVSEIHRNPLSARIGYHDFRRKLMRRFPFATLG